MAIFLLKSTSHQFLQHYTNYEPDENERVGTVLPCSENAYIAQDFLLCFQTFRHFRQN